MPCEATNILSFYLKCSFHFNISIWYIALWNTAIYSAILHLIKPGFVCLLCPCFHFPFSAATEIPSSRFRKEWQNNLISAAI